MSDVKYTNRSIDAYPTQITPKSPPPPPPEHLYLPPLPPLDSNSITHSFDTESPAFANNAPDSRDTSASTQPPSLEDHHHDNVSTADECDSVVNSTDTPRTFSISSFNRDEDVPKDTEPSKVINIETPNPSHLFWVPAAQHPEIAPNEFEIFLQHNAMAKRERSSLKRRSSILSVSFTASDAEKQENDENRLEGDNRNDALQALERGNRHGSSERNERIQLLQQQQENDSNKGGGEEGSQRKARLRRSLSLDTATAAENQMRVPDFLVFDRNSSPLDQSKVLVPKADRPSLLRRGARTRFQRNSSFTPPSARQQVDRHRQAESMPPGAYTERFDTTTFEEGIALSDGPLELTSNFSLPLAEPSPLPPHHYYQQQQENAASEASTTFTPRPMERRASAEEIPRLQNRSSSTKTHEIQALEIGQNMVTQESTPSDHTTHEQQQHPDVPTQSSSERKSAWSWGFKRSKSEQVRGDVTGDKAHLQAEAVPQPRHSVSTESSINSNASATTPTHLPSNNGGKESGGKRSFGLSSLFSRKSSASKGQTTSTYPTTTNTAPTAPKDFQLNRINQNRLPIHIERTIYRLSHSKLANPRRPLHEQVLISNLMFWYLSLVSSPQHQQHQQPNSTSPDNKTRKFVNPGKKGKRRPQSNSSSPRQSSSQSHHNHQQQKQKQQHHPQELKQSQAGHNRPPSLSNKSSPPPQQQKNRSNSKQQQQQQENGNVVLNQYMGASTGFVVPENYLKPRQQGSKGMAGVGRNSSLSDSDEDDDDDDGVLSDSSSDEEPSNNNVTMKARVAAATKHRTSNDLVPNHNTRVSKQRGDDNVPLAMYRKGKA